jgi:hypothetical protein
MRETAADERPEPAGRWWRVRVALLTEPFTGTDNPGPRIERRLRAQHVRVIRGLLSDGGTVVATLVLSTRTAGAATDEAAAVLRYACEAEDISVAALHEVVVTAGEEVGFGWGAVEP